MAGPRKHIARSLLLFLGGVGLFFAVLNHVGLDGFEKLAEVRYQIVTLAVLATLGMIVIVATRWRIIVSSSGGETATWGCFVRCCASTAFMGRLIPKDLADVGGRTYWLQKSGNRCGLTAAGSVVLDRICDLVPLLCLLPWSLLVLAGRISFLGALIGAGGMLLVAAVLLTAFRHWVFSFVEKMMMILARFLSRFPLLPKVSVSPLDLRVPDARFMFLAIGLSILKVMVMATQYVLYSKSFGLELPDSVLMAGIPVCQAAFLFSFTAGGLGVLEAGWLGVFSLAGVSGPEIGTFLLGQRLLDIVCVSVAATFVQVFGALTSNN